MSTTKLLLSAPAPSSLLKHSLTNLRKAPRGNHGLGE
ncbi:hypothetical protein I311_05040 [Cryptococcus gattii NT-10]|nr:hypothetical protein I311_05040 [Cryptococcus gattii NT-10]